MSALSQATREISPHNTWVYVVRSGKFVKIGHSRNVPKRIAGLQTGCPLTVRLVRQWVSHMAPEIETRAHKALSEYRLEGEWFDVPAQVAVSVVGAYIAANPRNPAAAVEPTRSVVFCAHCKHTATLKAVPEASRLRCISCTKPNSARVVALV